MCALWSPAWKGLASWLSFVVSNFEFVTFPIGILGQVWYLIGSIFYICSLTYFAVKQSELLDKNLQTWHISNICLSF